MHPDIRHPVVTPRVYCMPIAVVIVPSRTPIVLAPANRAQTRLRIAQWRLTANRVACYLYPHVMEFNDNNVCDEIIIFTFVVSNGYRGMIKSTRTIPRIKINGARSYCAKKINFHVTNLRLRTGILLLASYGWPRARVCWVIGTNRCVGLS